MLQLNNSPARILKQDNRIYLLLTIMTFKTILIHLLTGLLFVTITPSFAQHAPTKTEQKQAEELAKEKAVANELRLSDADALKASTKADAKLTRNKAKEAKRVEKEAANAAKQAKRAARMEAKAQRNRADADRQAKKAAKATKKSNAN
jgi:hypothetical protein